MPAMTPPEPFGLARLPLPENYCGHTEGAPYHPQLKVVPTDREDGGILRIGVFKMMQQMSDDAQDAMALLSS